MSAVCQQILALDARYNAYRLQNSPQTRTLYIRRRSQLLQEKAKQENDCRRDYLQMRSMLLAQRYGVTPMSDVSSIRSRTVSMQGSATRFPHGHLDPNNQNLETLDFLSQGVAPTSEAEFSRAMAGDTTLAENYAFAGMHHIFDQHKMPVYSVKFGVDDKSRLACCSIDGQISICQLLPEPATVICVLQGHKAGVTDFVWSISNDRILSCSLDATVRLWSVAAGQCIRTIPDPHGAQLLRCVFQPINNNLFVTGSAQGHLQVMNLSTGKVVKGGSAKLSGAVQSLCYDTVGTLLWAGDQKGGITAFVCDQLGALHKTKRVTVYENVPVTSISYRTWTNREARNPVLLVNVAADVLCLFRVTSDSGNILLKRKFPVKHQKGTVRSSFCPLMSFRQGSCVVSGSEDGCVYLFDLDRDIRPCVNTLLGHSGAVLDACFNYDESMLATCDQQGTVIVWKREMQKN